MHQHMGQWEKKRKSPHSCLYDCVNTVFLFHTLLEDIMAGPWLLSGSGWKVWEVKAEGLVCGLAPCLDSCRSLFPCAQARLPRSPRSHSSPAGWHGRLPECQLCFPRLLHHRSQKAADILLGFSFMSVKSSTRRPLVMPHHSPPTHTETHCHCASHEDEYRC